MPYLWIGLGGALGAMARYAVGTWLVARLDAVFPWSTFAVNVSGSLAIGAVLTLLLERFEADPAWRLFVVVGFLGGYTTFSSYAFEALTLLRTGQSVQAAWYVLGSNSLSLLACFLGMALARWLTLTRS